MNKNGLFLLPLLWSPVYASTWSGPYVGLEGGWGMLMLRQTQTLEWTGGSGCHRGEFAALYGQCGAKLGVCHLFDPGLFLGL